VETADTTDGQNLDGTQGNLLSPAVQTTTDGDDRFVIEFTSAGGGGVSATSNLEISGFDAGDRLYFDDVADSVTTLSGLLGLGLYNVSDQGDGNDVTISANSGGVVQSITLLEVGGDRSAAGVGSSIDDLEELNTFFGANVVELAGGSSAPTPPTTPPTTPPSSSVPLPPDQGGPAVETADTTDGQNLDGTQGNLLSPAVQTTTDGDDRFVIEFTSAGGGGVSATSNLEISGFDAGDRLYFDDVADSVTTLSGLLGLGLYNVSDQGDGNDVTISANSGGVVQSITLVGVSGDRSATGVGSSIDDLEELSTFFGANVVEVA
jgi:hypothetical protein